MEAKEKALALHAQGFNCAQCVLCALGSYTGLDEKTALALAAGFGGGVRCGEICGAVSGAVMALGLADPWNDAQDTAGKARITKQTIALTKAFTQAHGCIRCVDLKRAGVPCDELIAWATAKGKDMLQNKESI